MVLYVYVLCMGFMYSDCLDIY